MTKRLTIKIPKKLYKLLKVRCRWGTVSRFMSEAVEKALVEKRIDEALRKVKT